MVHDKSLLQTSVLDIQVASLHVPHLPLFLLEPVISKVHLPSFRRAVNDRREAASNLDNSHRSYHNPYEYQNHPSDLHPSPHVHQYSEPSFDNIPNTPSDQPSTEQRSQSPNDPPVDIPAAERDLNSADIRDVRDAIARLESAASVHNRARVSLATALLSPPHHLLQRHVPQAVQHLRRAADEGYADAQALLGFLYASGMAGTALRKDTGAAVLMWTFAAEAGSLYAKMALAYRYFTGTDVPEDCDKAAFYYQQVAEAALTDAKDSLSRHLSSSQVQEEERAGENVDGEMKDIRPPTPSTLFSSEKKHLTEHMQRRVRGEANEIVQYYRHSADRGDAAAQVFMGNVYYYGANDMPQDLRRARRLFELAAEQGRADAHAHLGYMELRAGNNKTAAFHLHKAARRFNKLGLHGMGFITLRGLGVAKDAKLAASYFNKAIEKEHPESMYNLAIMYSKGIGVPYSLENSYLHMQAAAHFGHMQSSYNVGVMMLKGIAPARRDCSKATHFLKKVSEGGVWNERISKAFRAYEKSEFADALYHYLQAAHGGIEVAQFNAAFMFEHNSLTNRRENVLLSGIRSGGKSQEEAKAERAATVEEALDLYQMSSSQGWADAMVRMGDLAFGEARDYARAASAYERAGKLGNAEAMFNLGWMHARGFGMKADKHMAKRYFDMAKSSNADAILPATIAVFSLDCSDWWLKFVDRFAPHVKGWRETDVGTVEISDGVVLAILLGALVLVVNARQRRMVRLRAEEAERGATQVANEE